jgi:myo-inositol-1(or 4)-monophosphatase
MINAKDIDASLLEEIEACAVEIARAAGSILMEHFRQPLEVRFKGKDNTDPVTIADRRSDEYLNKAIRDKFPGHGILSEEEEASGGSDSPFTWVLDPLDGTTNFMNGLPLFASSVGVLWQTQPVAGGIYVPVSHHGTPGVYHARLGGGAYLDDEKIEVVQQPSGRPLAGNPFSLGRGFRLSGKGRKRPHESRNIGSMVLELTWAACGIFEYAVFSRPKIWDVAAAHIVIKEAGGVIMVRPKRDHRWQPLTQFRMESWKDGKTPDLRDWSLPVIAGAPDAVQHAAAQIHNRRSLSRFFRWPGLPKQAGSASHESGREAAPGGAHTS